MLKLRTFQREDVDDIKAHGVRALVASAPGTGKTSIAISSILESKGQSTPALIVCPASVTHNWKREFRMWAPGFRVHIIDDISSPVKEADAYITSWSLLDPRLPDLQNIGFKAVVADEAHLAKNPDALRSQALYQLTRKPKNGLLLLTGTPIINTTGEMDVLQSLFGKTPLLIRRLLEDVAPDVPPKHRSYLHINLRDRDQSEYDRATADFEDWLYREKRKLLETGAAQDAVDRALAAEAFVKVGYLRRLVGEAKVHAAADWATRAVRIGEPVVIFLEHQNALLRLEKALRRQRVRYAVIEGKTSPKDRHRLVEEFQGNKFPVLICTKAGKEGITLHAARHLLFVERFFTSAEEEQMEDRIRRIGQKHPTTIWYLHAAGTIDDRLDHIVRSKRIIVRDAIGAADTGETAESNVEAVLKSWSTFVQEKKDVVDLGRGEPLPPLPSPGDTHAVVFYGERWKTGSAARWCRMNGYLPSSRVDLLKRFKLVVHPIDVFKSEKFSVIKVCEDVRVILGKRISAENEAVVRQRLKRIEG